MPEELKVDTRKTEFIDTLVDRLFSEHSTPKSEDLAVEIIPPEDIRQYYRRFYETYKDVSPSDPRFKYLTDSAHAALLATILARMPKDQRDLYLGRIGKSLSSQRFDTRTLQELQPKSLQLDITSRPDDPGLLGALGYTKPEYVFMDVGNTRLVVSKGAKPSIINAESFEEIVRDAFPDIERNVLKEFYLRVIYHELLHSLTGNFNWRLANVDFASLYESQPGKLIYPSIALEALDQSSVFGISHFMVKLPFGSIMLSDDVRSKADATKRIQEIADFIRSGKADLRLLELNRIGDYSYAAFVLRLIENGQPRYYVHLPVLCRREMLEDVATGQDTEIAEQLATVLIQSVDGLISADRKNDPREKESARLAPTFLLGDVVDKVLEGSGLMAFEEVITEVATACIFDQWKNRRPIMTFDDFRRAVMTTGNETIREGLMMILQQDNKKLEEAIRRGDKSAYANSLLYFLWSNFISWLAYKSQGAVRRIS